MNMNRFASFAAVALVATLVTGCGKDGAGAEEGTRTSIASLTGQDTGWSEEEYRDQETQVQELVATCMIEQGWEYIPVEYPDAMYEYNPEDELERLQREGFGIAYWTLNQGNDEAMGNDPFADWVDPNQAIMEAMEEDEVTAYQESLWGTQEEQEAAATVEVDPETGEEMWTMTGWGPGCQGEAQEQVYGAQQSQGDEDYWNAVSGFYDDLQVRVEADPRMKALNDGWVACMAEAGYDYESPNAIWESVYADLQARHDEIVGPDFYADPMEGWTEDEIAAFWETATEDEINDLFNYSRDITDDQRAALEDLLADEIEISVAQWQCSEPMQEESMDLYQQIEEEFALEHRAELEEIAASFGADS